MMLDFSFKVKAHGPLLSGVLKSYYFGQDHPMKLRLWGWFRKALGHPRLTVPYARKGYITLDERDWLQRQIWLTGAYEYEIWEALSKHFVADEIMWDIGAHIGSFAVRGQLDPRVKEVHAFEPNPTNRAALKLNSSLNPGYCVVHSVALSDQPQIKQLYLGPIANTGLTSLVGGEHSNTSVEVECRRIDDLIWQKGLDKPTVLKIDVEGWELHVLRGAQCLLREHPPKAILFEDKYFDPLAQVEEPINSFLGTFGYKVSHVRRPSGEIEERENYIAEFEG